MRLALLLPLALSACFYVSAEEREARGDLDEDGVPWSEDCDLADPAIGRLSWYADTDGDGFGDAATEVVACEPPEGHVADNTDCDDTSNQVFPGAPELCNGVDDDCDTEVDNGANVPTWYEDSDGDGQGDPDMPVSACGQPPGAVGNADDCDDTDPAVKLGGVEVCDGQGIDEDCDGDADLDDSDIDPLDHTFYLDGDGDNYGVDDPLLNVVTCGTPPSGYVPDLGDCVDDDDTIHPNAVEACNGYDDDCDGQTDPPGSYGAVTYRLDADGDGQGGPIEDDFCAPPTEDWILPAGVPDCDDNDPCTYNGAMEICDDGIDQDCDTVPDDGNCVFVDTADTGGGACY